MTRTIQLGLRPRRALAARGAPAGALLAAVVLTGYSLAGCSSVRLVPLQPSAPGQSLVTSSNIEVQADTRAKGPSAMPSNVTPVHLTIRNLSEKSVYVDLGDIELHGASHSLDAVPPLTIEPRHRIASLGLDPASPFVVEQTTDSSGPHVGRTESVLIEPGFGTGTSARLPGTPDRARDELLQSALQSGVIPSGQTLEGFVYFPRVPRDAGQLTLEVGVRRAPKVAPDSVVQIPYSVQS
jgi:hypothetical protein